MPNDNMKAYNLSVRDDTTFRVTGNEGGSGGNTMAGPFIAHDTDGTLDCSYNDLKQAWEDGMLVFVERSTNGESDGTSYVRVERFILESLEESISSGEFNEENYSARFAYNAYYSTTADSNMQVSD